MFIYIKCTIKMCEQNNFYIIQQCDIDDNNQLKLTDNYGMWLCELENQISKITTLNNIRYTNNFMNKYDPNLFQYLYDIEIDLEKIAYFVIHDNQTNLSFTEGKYYHSRIKQIIEALIEKILTSKNLK